MNAIRGLKRLLADSAFNAALLGTLGLAAFLAWAGNSRHESLTKAFLWVHSYVPGNSRIWVNTPHGREHLQRAFVVHGHVGSFVVLTPLLFTTIALVLIVSVFNVVRRAAFIRSITGVIMSCVATILVVRMFGAHMGALLKSIVQVECVTLGFAGTYALGGLEGWWPTTMNGYLRRADRTDQDPTTSTQLNTATYPSTPVGA
jgi:hypothetical protein